MAKWRPLHRNVTTSDKMLQLAIEGEEFAQWLWTALLPYTDRAGRLNGNPLALLGTIFEGYPYSPEKLEAGLHALARVGLVVLYRTARQQLLVEYTNFEELNVFDKREAQSQLPGPSDEGSEVLQPPPGGSTDPEGAPPEHPKETTGEVQDAPGSSRPLHVHGDTTDTSTATENTLVVREDEAQPPPAVVEAAPRRERETPRGEIKRRRGRDPNAVRPVDQPYVDAWNEHRGPLPRILTVGTERERALDRLRRELGDQALDVFRDAVRQVARERSYREKGYGFGNLLSGGDAKVLKWAEKWRSTGGLSDSDRRIADKAQAVADAIGGLR